MSPIIAINVLSSDCARRFASWIPAIMGSNPPLYVPSIIQDPFIHSSTFPLPNGRSIVDKAPSIVKKFISICKATSIAQEIRPI